MNIVAQIFVGIVIIIHLYIVYIEMFAWETLGKKSFKGAMPDELFKPTKTLAGNQGLYNFFLAAGLIWTFFVNDNLWKYNVAYFFLSCIIIAGLYGTFTASEKIFFVQTLPAAIAIICLMIAK